MDHNTLTIGKESNVMHSLKALAMTGLFLTTLVLGGCAGSEKISINSIRVTPSPTSILKKGTQIDIMPTITVQPKIINTQTADGTSISPTSTTIPITNNSSILLHSLKREIGGMIISEDGEIQKQLIGLYTNLTFSNDLCYLIGIAPSVDGNIVIEKLDFTTGNTVESKTVPVTSDVFSPTMFGFSLSPDEKWLSYLLPGYYDGPNPRQSGNKEVILINVGEPNRAILLTDKGGETESGPIWTKDGQFVIYTGMDQSNIPQIYSYNILTQDKKKLSNFDSRHKDLIFYKIKLSPDEKFIGFIGSSEQGNGYVGVIEFDTLLLKWMELPVQNYVPLHDLYWNASSTQLLTLLSANLRTTLNSEFITWFNVNTGEILNSFPVAGNKTYFISIVFPLSKDLSRVGFYGAEIKGEDNQASYYLYNANDKSIKTIELPELCCSPFEFIVPKSTINLKTCK